MNLEQSLDYVRKYFQKRETFRLIIYAPPVRGDYRRLWAGALVALPRVSIFSFLSKIAVKQF